MHILPVMLKQYLFFLSALLPLSLLGQPGRGFTIAGRITGVKDGTKVYIKDIDEKQVLDSAIILNERFLLKGSVKMPSTCWLECLDQYSTIQVENTAMQFESPLELMRLYAKATGGTEQALQNELTALQYAFDHLTFTSYDSLNKKKYKDDEDRKRLAKVLNDSQDSSQLIYIRFGIQHPDSWLGMDILYRNRQHINKDTLRNLLSLMRPELSAHMKARSIREYVFGKLVRKGEPFIDFEATTLEGRAFRLSSLKGQYVLLSFWDAGCVPCRRENKTFSKEQASWNNKLQIVSFSLDKNREAWAKASAADHISWYNVSDNQGGSGSIKTQYDVQAMPAAFLINPQGVVIEIFTGFSDDFLGQLLKLVG